MTIELTKLESDVMERLLAPFVEQSGGAVTAFLKSLFAIDRSLSEDALDQTKCCGFYVKFEQLPLPIDAGNLPPRLSVQAQREGLPFGADFILFLTADHHLRFLEATFYGCSIPSVELMKNDHGFRFA